MAVHNVVPFGLEWDLWYRWFRYSWSQARMGTAPVVVRDPGFEDHHANVALIEWNRKPLRCQRTNVSGLKLIRASDQSNHRDNRASVNRMESVTHRGLTLRSTKSASCFRRNRFSAATEAVGLRQSRRNVNASKETPKAVRRKC